MALTFVRTYHIESLCTSGDRLLLCLHDVEARGFVSAARDIVWKVGSSSCDASGRHVLRCIASHSRLG